jgi:hypothetical protein
MKKFVLLFLLFIPVYCFSQGQRGTVEACAPVKNGKVCFTDEEKINNASKDEVYEAIRKWANAEYGKDVFVSNVSANKARGTILVSSRYEIWLTQEKSTQIKFKMRIACSDNGYTAELTDIFYLYDPSGGKRLKTYPAEDVILDQGAGNKVDVITNPDQFCNTTFFFVENLFADVFAAAKGAQR